MEKIKVRVINKSGNPLPEYATPGSAAMDLRSNVSKELKSGETAAIPTGLFVEVPEGYMLSIRPRSGMALKNEVTVMNTPGTVDSDYRDEVMVILKNHSQKPFFVNPGDRIAQAIIEPVLKFEWEESDKISTTDRKGGFGSTGTK